MKADKRKDSRSHEIKNCLTVIRATATSLSPDVASSAQPRLARLEAATEKLEAIVHALLSELDVHEPRIAQVVSVEVYALAESVRELLSDRAQEVGVSIAVACQAGSVMAIPGELEQALFDVVSNALESTPRGGRVVIESGVDENGAPLLNVRDAEAGSTRERLGTFQGPLEVRLAR